MPTGKSIKPVTPVEKKSSLQKKSDGSIKKPKKKSVEFKPDKIRVRLTPIEEYEKKLVFNL